MIHLVYAHCPVTPPTERAFLHWLPLLPAGMQQQVLNYRHEQDRLLCLFGKVLLHKGLQLLGLRNDALAKVTSAPLQKPFLPDTDVDFSIAHSGEYAVVALSRTATVGIDLEQILPVELKNFKAHLTLQEWEELSQTTNPQELVYTHWTQKEAVLKATGKGLSIPMNSFESVDDQVRLDGQTWHLQEVNFATDYSCHVASNSPRPLDIQNLTSEVLRMS